MDYRVSDAQQVADRLPDPTFGSISARFALDQPPPRCVNLSSRMIFPLFRKARPADTIERLYGAIVAQARDPKFYAELGVPDTAEGRFEMIVLHVALFYRRLHHEAAPVRTIGQQVFDRFCRDMEHNLREMGVSDLAVPAKMRRLGAAFYQRASSYQSGLAAVDEGALAATLTRDVFFDGATGASGAAALAAYARAAAAALAAQDAAALAAGLVRFPDPTGGEP